MKISKFTKMLKEFGFKFTLSYTYNVGLFKIAKKQKPYDRKQNLILNYLTKNYMDCIPKDEKCENLDKNFKVWVFWYQGEEKMPDIVRACINSIKTHFKDNEVVLITKENVEKYANIPEYIMDKVNKKIITLTHFSDILRATLLSQNGGVWMDATLFLTKDITKELLSFPFYSNKLPMEDFKLKDVARGMWSGFFMSGNKNNPIFLGLRDVLFKYWEKHDVLIDYFFIDYIIRFLYDNSSTSKMLIDNVPLNNGGMHSLQKLLFSKYDEEIYKSVMASSNLFKLTWKFDEKNKEIQDTFYKKIIGETNE